MPSKPRSPKPHQHAVDVAEPCGRAVALDVLRFDPLQPHLRALADAAVLERFADRLVGVLVVDVLADDADHDLVDGMLDRVDHVDPFRQVGAGLGLLAQAQALDDQLVQTLRVQPHRNLVDVVEIDGRDDRLLRHIGEGGDLATLAVRQRLLAAAQQDVGLDADRTQFLDRVLGRLGLQLAGGRDVRHQGQMHEDRLLAAAVGADLADGFEERQRLDVADGAADLDQRHVVTGRGFVDRALDGVGDVRDDLHGRA